MNMETWFALDSLARAATRDITEAHRRIEKLEERIKELERLVNELREGHK